MSLPLTVLTGPSTVLRDDLLRCLVLRRPRLVGVRYDVEPGPDGVRLRRRVVDARGEQQVEQVELTGCCLSCTVREDAPSAVELVAGSGRWDEVVLALPASLSPGSLGSALEDLAGARLDTVATVVDARLLRAQVSGDDLLVERGIAAAPTDRRSTAELVCEQLEEADVLAIVGLDALAAGSASTIQALLAHLAPLAARVALGPGGSGCDDLVSTGRHDPGLDRTGLLALAGDLCPPACGVATVRWRSDRLLHPGRLHAAVRDVVAGVVRSRGVLLLAGHEQESLRWESAGGTLAVGDPRPWSGAPGNDLLLTGLGLDAARLTAVLDRCLASDAELAAGCGADPFAPVP